MPSRPVYHLDGEPGLRGGERQLLYLAAALRARGRRNVICARRGSDLEAEARFQEFETGSVWRARREGAIIHSHTGRDAKYAALAAWTGAPTVTHRRVDFAVSPLSARLQYGSAGKVVCVSKAIAALMKEAGTAEAKLIVIPDGLPVTPEESAWAKIEPGRFTAATAAEKMTYKKALAAEFNFAEDAILIGNLAALVPHKDHDTLLAAAVIVLLQRPKVKFLIAGRGPEERSLFESIQRMGLLGKVILAGHRQDPMPLLKALDVYVQSSWGEGMGSVLIEAAACGIPVAATTAGGIPEVVTDGETGLLVEPRNPEGLAKLLLRLIDEPATRERFAAEARRRVKRFGLTRMAADMEKIYDAL